MFTGLIEAVGRVASLSGGDLTIETDHVLVNESSPGDSIAVDGSCLTVTSIRGGKLVFHCSAETLFRSVVTGYHPGTVVNLERPLRADGRLHGHFVTGHIDEKGSILRVERRKEEATAWVSYSRQYSGLLVEKGSVTVSGISLTVASLLPDRFTVVLIGETLERTGAGGWKPGAAVNLEYDIIGKYINRLTLAAEGAGRLREYLEQDSRR